MVPKDVHTLILEPMNVTSHGKIDFEDVIEVNNLEMPWIIGWAQSNHKVLNKWKREAGEDLS